MIKFYKCAKCGQILTVFNPKCPGITCCGEPVKEIKANTQDAAKEKHVPAVTVNGSEIQVKIGSVPHPMESDHWIEWVLLETKNGSQIKNLNPGDAPELTFTLKDDSAIAAYAYCNKHGLWKADI